MEDRSDSDYVDNEDNNDDDDDEAGDRTAGLPDTGEGSCKQK